MRPSDAARLLALSACLSACAGTALPGFGSAGATEGVEAAATERADVAAVVVGESGLAAGIPAAVQAFPEPGGDAAVLEASPTRDRLPTLFPRQLPAEDAMGAPFADKVSISPDGRRLLVGTQQGQRFEVQIVGVNRKDRERREFVKGGLAFVGWAGPRQALFGYRRGGDLRIEALDVGTGKRRVVSDRPGEGGVLAVTEEGRAVAVRPGRTRFVCAGDGALPTEYEGAPVVQAGPLDARGRIVFRTAAEASEGVLVPYDCGAGRFAEPIYEGPPFTGALFDAGGMGYFGVWDEEGPRYLDPSLAYEMAEVAKSFATEVEVWPIEFTRSPNTVLVYVSGLDVPPSYYVLDRYAGALDLHVSYERQ